MQKKILSAVILTALVLSTPSYAALTEQQINNLETASALMVEDANALSALLSPPRLNQPSATNAELASAVSKLDDDDSAFGTELINDGLLNDATGKLYINGVISSQMLGHIYYTFQLPASNPMKYPVWAAPLVSSYLARADALEQEEPPASATSANLRHIALALLPLMGDFNQ